MCWGNLMPGRETLASVIVGGGPGGLGPLIWAAQNGVLHQWLGEGVALVERTNRLGGSLGRYGINSDSLGGSYLECLEAEAWPEALHHLRSDPITLEMQEYRTSFPPLSLVDRYMGRIGLALASTFATQSTSALHMNTAAQSIHLREDGNVTVVVHDSGAHQKMIVARSAIVALGGRQYWTNQEAAPGLTFAECAMRHVLPSNDLLSHEGLQQADQIMRAAGERRIIIWGGSHSAYAVAWALLELPGAKALRDNQIVIVQRRPPRVFYPTRADAAADFYEVEPGDICARTQRVNRMGGVRGHGRDIWRRIAQRPGVEPETRVAIADLQDLATEELRVMIEEASLVIPCLGYRSATLPIFDCAGRRLSLKADHNEDAVGEDCRLLLSDGTSLPNIFGIGLGTGFRPTPSMGCEPNFRGQANSLWLYQNDIAGVIYRAIHEMQGEMRTAVAA